MGLKAASQKGSGLGACQAELLGAAQWPHSSPCLAQSWVTPWLRSWSMERAALGGLCPQPASWLLVLLAVRRYRKGVSRHRWREQRQPPAPWSSLQERQAQPLRRRCSLHQAVKKQQHLVPSGLSCWWGQWEKSGYNILARRMECVGGCCLQGCEVWQWEGEQVREPLANCTVTKLVEIVVARVMLGSHT